MLILISWKARPTKKSYDHYKPVAFYSHTRHLLADPWGGAIRPWPSSVCQWELAPVRKECCMADGHWAIYTANIHVGLLKLLIVITHQTFVFTSQIFLAHW